MKLKGSLLLTMFKHVCLKFLEDTHLVGNVKAAFVLDVRNGVNHEEFQGGLWDFTYIRRLG